jgi:hypothetical protein
MSKTGRIFSIVAVAALVGYIAYVAYGYGTAESRVRGMCAEIKPGMAVAQLRRFAEARGLSAPSRESGATLLAEKRTFGRFGCKVTLQDGVVRASEYGFAD